MTETRGQPAPTATFADTATIEALPWLPLEGFDGVTYKLLWRSGKSVAGIMHIPPGSEVPVHRHLYSHHDMWVLAGEAEMIGRPAAAGTYLHVPAGVDHSIRPVGPDGCTVLYLYLRDESPPDSVASA